MIVTCRSRAALLCLVGSLATTAGAGQNAADRSIGNARFAVEALQGGLGDGSSVEQASAAGLKAEEFLVSGKAHDGGAGAVDASGGGQASRLAGKLGAQGEGRGHEARPAVPLPPDGPGEPEKPRGFLQGIRDGIGSLMRPAAASFGKLGKAKRVAVLVGLLAVEAAAVIYPYHVVGAAMVALGVLGLFGTTRELIGMIRRRDA